MYTDIHLYVQFQNAKAESFLTTFTFKIWLLEGNYARTQFFIFN